MVSLPDGFIDDEYGEEAPQAYFRYLEERSPSDPEYRVMEGQLVEYLRKSTNLSAGKSVNAFVHLRDGDVQTAEQIVEKYL